MLSCCLFVLLWFQAPPGAFIDTTPFLYSREIPPAPPGLSTIVLDAPVLAHGATDLGDLRIVDKSQRQIPYLLERRDGVLNVELTPRLAPEEMPPPKHTYYRVALPFEGLPSATLILTTDERVFQRSAQIRVKQGRPDPQTRSPWQSIASAAWRHQDPETEAPPLPFRFDGGLETNELLVDIEEGDNRPLALSGMRLELPSYQLRFFHPGNEPLNLFYGYKALPPPRYDIELLAPELSETTGRPLMLGEEQATSASKTNDNARYVLWVALIAAVGIILGVLIRLLRSGGVEER